jgi:erythromycin esterase-like protein
LKKLGVQYVLLGEASHGTHEYYTWRMKISKKLIEKKGFSFIAVEGDWPDCYKLNHIKNYPTQGICDRRSSFFQQVADLDVGQLGNSCLGRMASGHNDRHDEVGFYGLDVYSLWESLMRFLNI